MDNLDISDSLSSSFPWLPYGASPFDYQNGELGYFSQRSAMLEPIIEETSDDDDVSCGHVWTHNDNQWNSSESEADSSNSVIRVELIQGKFFFLLLFLIHRQMIEKRRKKSHKFHSAIQSFCTICISRNTNHWLESSSKIFHFSKSKVKQKKIHLIK